MLGAYFAQARLYDASSKRFMQTDPIGGNVMRTISLNPYLYCIDDPVNHIDPTGMYMPGDENLSLEQQAEIAVYTAQWEAANATGDKAGMDAAHAAANDTRNGTSTPNTGGNSVALEHWYELTAGLPTTSFGILVENIAKTAPSLSLDEVLLTAADWVDTVNSHVQPTSVIALNGLHSSLSSTTTDSQIKPLSASAITGVIVGADIATGGAVSSVIINGIVYIWGGIIEVGGVLRAVIYVISGKEVEVAQTIISGDSNYEAPEGLVILAEELMNKKEAEGKEEKGNNFRGALLVLSNLGKPG